MAWTAPRTWVTAEIVTAALLNTHVRDNLLAINTLFDIAAGTYADGGLFLGSAAAAVTILARATAGQLPVGQTTGDPINRDVFVDGAVNPKVRHENGGIEADISAVVADDSVFGTGAGTMALRVQMTQAQAEAGSDTSSRPVSALRIKQAIDALGGVANTGTNFSKVVRYGG